MEYPNSLVVWYKVFDAGFSCNVSTESINHSKGEVLYA